MRRPQRPCSGALPDGADNRQLVAAVADGQFADILADVGCRRSQVLDFQVSGGHAADNANAVIDASVERRNPQANVAGRHQQVVAAGLEVASDAQWRTVGVAYDEAPGDGRRQRERLRGRRARITAPAKRAVGSDAEGQSVPGNEAFNGAGDRAPLLHCGGAVRPVGVLDAVAGCPGKRQAERQKRSRDDYQ